MSPIWEMKSPLRELFSPIWGFTKPTERLNMPCLRNEFGRRYMHFTTQVKTPITGQTYFSDLEEFVQ